ncbi:MAG: CBS domain-containing protein [Chloroflexi bacterium]|nr:CBS domain-containing protein [Chloroflexota bacterium]
MIPKRMESYLRERLPQATWESRLTRDGSKRFIELTSADVDRLSRLGIEVDNLGPHLVVCLWDEDSPLEIGGYLVVDNLAMGRPSMGGIRMLGADAVTPAAIHNLARGMTLKNAAANLPYGGGKSGIVADSDLTPEQHTEVVRGFAKLIFRYRDIYLPGPDVGTNDSDMKTVAIENGIDHALSKPVDMGGNRIDQLGAAGGGTVIALQALLEEMPRLRSLPQFANLQIPSEENLTVIIQGFGAVGAHAARVLRERLPKAKVIGVSDAVGYIYDENGLPIETLFKMWQQNGVVTRPYFLQTMAQKNSSLKYATQPNDLLRENAFCCIPAAPIANYLDTDSSSRPSMTVDRMGKWTVSIEGANTYSPDPSRKAARARMERAVYRGRSVLIATDYLVNSGGVIFAAHEKLIKTPQHLRLPDSALGNRVAVDKWLTDHAAEFAALAEGRRAAAEKYREEVIRKNMRELIDLLATDADMLPREASEHISVRRIAARESGRTAQELMTPIPTINVSCSVKEAATKLVEAKSPIIAVVESQGALAGVVTEWDITRATAQGSPDDQSITQIMSRQVVAASPNDGILDMVRKLEYYEISAMPVVDNEGVQGMISADVLARKSLLRLVQSQS